jgi:hypothetical protein
MVKGASGERFSHNKSKMKEKPENLLLLYLFRSSKCNNQSVTPHVTPYSHLMKQDNM